MGRRDRLHRIAVQEGREKLFCASPDKPKGNTICIKGRARRQAPRYAERKEVIKCE